MEAIVETPFGAQARHPGEAAREKGVVAKTMGFAFDDHPWKPAASGDARVVQCRPRGSAWRQFVFVRERADSARPASELQGRM